MECPPSGARAAWTAALANSSSPAKVSFSFRRAQVLLDPLLFLRLLLPALLLELLLALLLCLLLREEHVGDRDVDLGHPQAHQVLDPVDHVAPDGLGELRDGLAVLGRERKIDGRLFLPDLDGDPLRLAAAAPAGYGAQDAADGLRGAAAHPDAVDLLGRDTGYLRYDTIRDGGAAALGLKRAAAAPPLATFTHAHSLLSSVRPTLRTAYLYRPAREQPVDGEQDDRAQRSRQYGPQAKALRAPGEAQQVQRPAPDKGSDDPDQGGDHDASRVRSRHDPLRQDTCYQPDHYPDYDGPDAYGFHLSRLYRANVPDGTLVEHINSRCTPRYFRPVLPLFPRP